MNGSRDHGARTAGRGRPVNLERRLREQHRLCLPALARLRLLAMAPSGGGGGTELRRATDEVMAELGAAERLLLDSLRDSVRARPIGHLLACRVNRLAIVAEHAAVAAEAGDVPAQRALLYQFNALAEAMWKVQLGVRPGRECASRISVGQGAG
ncbi:hypothetical protein [Spirillospora albida]|uniref:hypothetical protein n=1 Tax=Spirillospora albida TaxID=58123 RepID=UPI0012F730D5|nr:hypothetical protein [Spirillospora albida]